MDRHFPISSRLLIAMLLAAAPVSAAVINVSGTAPYELSLDGGPTFHTTEAVVTNPTVIDGPDPILLLLWNEQVAPEDPIPYYALSFEGGAVSRVYSTSYEFKLTAGDFDPLPSGALPSVNPLLQADVDNELYIVQFFTQPLMEFSDAIEALAGTIRGFIPDNARIVEMDATTKTAVETLDYVRWVGPYHPSYRLEAYLRENIDQALSSFSRSSLTTSWCSSAV